GDFAALAANSDQLERAAALYRGDLFEDVDGLPPEMEAWLKSERQRLNDLAVGVLEQLSLRAASNGASGEAIRLGRCLLASDPLREPVYCALMRLAALKGDRAEALKTYSACRDVLKRELGVGPDIRTEELYRDIITDRLSKTSNMSQVARPIDRPSV